MGSDVERIVVERVWTDPGEHEVIRRYAGVQSRPV
jgi:hypothetical protein